MNLAKLRNELSIRGKNGIAFLLSASILWFVFTIIYMQPLPLQSKNIILLIMTGLLFPLAVGIAKLIKADWKLEDHPFSQLGLLLNLAQFMYFPIVFWALVGEPKKMIVFFAVITGAHFFPYGWFYQAKAYYVMAPIISVIIMILGWKLSPSHLWIIPLVMVIFLATLICWLVQDYKQKKQVEKT